MYHILIRITVTFILAQVTVHPRWLQVSSC